MRARIAGGGLAGALLAWRLARHAPESWRIELLDPGRQDATAVSGGAVRGYETDPGQRRLALESLAELLGSALLRERAGYRPSTAVTLRESAAGLAAAAAEIEAVLPGSASVVGPAELAGYGFAGVPAGAAALLERTAGWFSPARLRAAVLDDPAVRRRVTVVRTPLGAVTPRPGELLVLATGPWTPALLGPAAGYRTKAIQYAVHPVSAGLPPQFVDELTGLFGRPTGDGGLLLGLPTEAWDVRPDRPPVVPALADRAAGLARARFPGLRLGPAAPPVAGCDCYAGTPGLALRPVAPGVFTFTGGAGGSAKTALAASRHASARLLAAGPPTETSLSVRTEGQR